MLTLSQFARVRCRFAGADDDTVLVLPFYHSSASVALLVGIVDRVELQVVRLRVCFV